MYPAFIKSRTSSQHFAPLPVSFWLFRMFFAVEETFKEWKMDGLRVLRYNIYNISEFILLTAATFCRLLLIFSSHW